MIPFWGLERNKRLKLKIINTEVTKWNYSGIIIIFFSQVF